MNTANIKAYAPKARRDFIQAVTEKAHLLGLSEDHVEPVEIKGDVAIIAGRPYPKKIGELRQQLVDRINREGFEVVMRAMAYTWFNRFVAIRYMELHDYLDHGFRVLSNRTGSEIPEILEHATDVELPGLNKEEVVRLRLAGDKDNELYQLLVVAQCNALHQAMPFLFERIGGYDELLMPDNLLHSNSPVRNLVNQIPEEEWQQIEIIGWIYQFYISEKKDEVIGKVVASVDIPAATQLFTPNWIVKYMVQNSLGAQWLATYPDSKLKGQMDYYIEPAEQTDEVKAQLAAITPSTLTPEALTLIDPASGSGHILVEAYELFKAIYLERGYRQRDVAQLILEKNLYGLDIDGRAAQLTGFALMMKGRADDRRLFERGVQLNVMALVDSTGFDAERLENGLNLADYGLRPADLMELKGLFEHATTFGSLIQVPEGMAAKLPAFRKLSEVTGLFVTDALQRLGPLVQQAELLAAQYDAVVANPPYMGSKSYCPPLKKFVNDTYSAGKADLYGAFTLRNIQLAKKNGHTGMITIPSWMFLSSFEQLRTMIFQDAPIASLVHNGRGVWGSDFGSCSYILRRSCHQGLIGCFLRLFDKQGSVAGNEVLERRFFTNPRFSTSNMGFKKIPGSPVAYWMPRSIMALFERHKKFRDFARPAVGLNTGDNDRFLRLWQEVSVSKTVLKCLSISEAELSGKTWFPYNKGGQYRKWYGNSFYVMNWENDGKEVKDYAVVRNGGKHWSRYIQNLHWMFKEGVSWSATSSSYFGARFTDPGFLFDVKGTSAFPERVHPFIMVGFLTTKLVSYLLSFLNPTIEFQTRDIGNLPFAENIAENVNLSIICESCIELERIDWNAYERSWDFQTLPLLGVATTPEPSIESSYTKWVAQNRETIAEMKRLEEENNRLFIDAYGLADELTPDVPIEHITLTVNPAYRYGGKLTEEELWTRFLQDTMQELVSYTIGCMMGRYSLDEPGLIYAHSGNEGFDPNRYTTFSADDDGIVPLTDTEWFDDDATHRLVEFISKAWDSAHLEDNLTFLADNLSPKKNESSRDTIRRYLCDSFFKDHLQTYKKRPIYWLLSSGKQKAFQCLVYLHRYNESTLSRVRSAYVTPLFGNFNGRLEYLQNERDAADTASAKQKIQKEIDDMKKKLAELSTFDDELRHYADKRISLDLDDGVKVNYGKFGNLLAETKAVTAVSGEK
jgi:type II restriction/modification system DNA methylase subunit YeeA